MTGTTNEVKVTEIGYQLDPNKKQFKLDPSGRTNALQVDYGDGEYDLYICYENKFFKTKFVYESIILKYFYSNKLDRLMYIETINLKASDNTFVKLSDGSFDDGTNALDEDGNIKDGYITEAKYYESTVGPYVSQGEFTGIRRRFNLQ
jgi:hypothetical protein